MSVLLVALSERITPPDNVRSPVMLFVSVRLAVSVAEPLNSILLLPVNVSLPPIVVVLPSAFAPLRSVLAEMLTPFRASVLVPHADLLPSTNVPLLRVVAPE